MKIKCNFCNYKDIDHIIYYDIKVDKCAKCDYIKMPLDTFNDLIINSINIDNFMNIKKYHNLYEMPLKDLKIIRNFIKSFDISNFVFENMYDTILCNFCHDKAFLIRNRFFIKFNMYYCEYCKSVYFLRSEFEDALVYLKKYAIQKSKWYGFIYYFLEIFQ